MLRVRFDSGAQYVCTATLVTSRTLLTAAHCLDPALAGPGNTAVTDVWVQPVSPAPPSSSPLWQRIDPARTRRHPGWSASDRLSNDFAAVLLPTASSITPAPYLDRALSAADVGTSLDVVGFGITASGRTDFGTRRHAVLPLRGLTARHLQLGDMSMTGICNGDSGGPTFLRGRDGVRRIVGVHSYDSSLQCNDGLDSRVDLFRSFVQQFITDEEGGPTCFEDGLCRMGCATPDVDCVCLADGQCSADCPNLLTDPDCPADCVANGVCATGACPRPDPDCTPELSACSTPAQCQYRTCAVDPQRPTSYCSRPCSAGCADGTSCVNGVCLQPQRPTAAKGEACDPVATFCLDDTQCTAFPSETLTCRETCGVDADCGTPGACVVAANGARLCRPTEGPGAPCVEGVTLCTGGTACSGQPGESLRCVVTCQSDASCTDGAACIAALAGQRLCQPTAAPGEACVAALRKCTGGTECTAPFGEALRCERTCREDADCPASSACVEAQLGERLCQAQVQVLPALGEASGPALGCSSIGAGGAWVLGPWLLMRRRRRLGEDGADPAEAGRRFSPRGSSRGLGAAGRRRSGLLPTRGAAAQRLTTQGRGR